MARRWPRDAPRNTSRRPLIHIAPVGAGAHFDHQRNREFVDSFHFFLDQLLKDVFFFDGRFKEQFIVNLQDHPGGEFFFPEALVDGDHGKFDEIRSSALQGRIQRGAFGKVSQLHLRGVDFSDRANAAEERFGDSGFARFHQNIVQILFDAPITGEIRVDELRGFSLFDAELLGQAERGKTVNNAEVDGFGGAAMARGLRRANAENFLSGARMNVFAIPEGLDQHGILEEKWAMMRNSICE